MNTSLFLNSLSHSGNSLCGCLILLRERSHSSSQFLQMSPLLSISYLLWFVCLFVCLFVLAAPEEYGSSQASRGHFRAAAGGLHNSHNNARSFNPLSFARIKPTSSRITVRFLTRWMTTGSPQDHILVSSHVTQSAISQLCLAILHPFCFSPCWLPLPTGCLSLPVHLANVPHLQESAGGYVSLEVFPVSTPSFSSPR